MPSSSTNTTYSSTKLALVLYCHMSFSKSSTDSIKLSISVFNSCISVFNSWFLMFWKILKTTDIIKNTATMVVMQVNFVIFIPKGDKEDNTRLPKYYDALWNYLTSIGIETI